MLMAHWIMECFFNLGLYPFQPSQILSGQGIHLIDVPSLVTWSTWVTTLLLGVPRNKRLSLGPPLKLNIGIWPQLLLSSLGFVKCWRTLVFFFLPSPPPPSFGEIMFLPLLLSQILFFMLAPSMWRFIITLFLKRCFAKIFMRNTFPLVINLLIFSPRACLHLVLFFSSPKSWCLLTLWFWWGMWK